MACVLLVITVNMHASCQENDQNFQKKLACIHEKTITKRDLEYIKTWNVVGMFLMLSNSVLKKNQKGLKQRITFLDKECKKAHSGWGRAQVQLGEQLDYIQQLKNENEALKTKNKRQMQLLDKQQLFITNVVSQIEQK